MNSRVAILDLGTNTFHLLIVEIEHSVPKLIHQETIAVRLGDGGISNGSISPEAFQRGLDAVQIFKERIEHFKTTILKSAATSGIRSAANRQEFIEQIKILTGFEIEIIDGEREAELIYLGVKAAVHPDKKCLIVDIGGGSVEFIICDDTGILWKESYPIGAARLMDKFHHTDPISIEEINSINNYLDEVLAELRVMLKMHNPELIIGSAGAFETFAELQDVNYNPSFENAEHSIDLRGLIDVYYLIIDSKHEERKEMPQIPAVRVDMIVVAAILTKFILDLGDFKSMKVSSYSLKEGLLFELLE